MIKWFGLRLPQQRFFSNRVRHCPRDRRRRSRSTWKCAALLSRLRTSLGLLESSFPDRLDRRRLRRGFEDVRPVELNVGVVLLEQADRIFVDRGTPDTHSRRGAKPIQDSRLSLAASARVVDERGGFVSATIAGQAERSPYAR